MTSFTKSFISRRKIEVPNTDMIQNVIQTRELITKTYLEDLTVLPRAPPRKVKGLQRSKTPWDFNKSVFKDYLADNEAILNKCFEYDWSNSKISKIVKDLTDLGKIKNYLNKNYKLM